LKSELDQQTEISTGAETNKTVSGTGSGGINMGSGMKDLERPILSDRRVYP
jgi:hypothetical protein